MPLTVSTQIIIVFVAILLIGLILGEQRMQRIAMSSFVGLAIVQVFSEPLLDLVLSRSPLEISLGMIKIILFIATIFLLSFHKKSDFFAKSKISVKSAILSFLSAGFISTTILGFLEQNTLDHLITDHNLISMIYAFKFWFMGLIVIWMIVMNFWPKSKKDKDLK